MKSYMSYNVTKREIISCAPKLGGSGAPRAMLVMLAKPTIFPL
jgi:hypothetical protein